MKTLEQIIKQDPVFINDWADGEKFAVMCDFEDIYITKEEFEATTCPIPNKEWWVEKKAKAETALKEWEGRNILFASYGQANYSGDAWVLFEEGGELFEVNGGHCSCYGLEGQWEAEKVELVELEHRLLKGTWGVDDWSDNTFKPQLMAFLGLSDGENVDTIASN